MEEKDDRWMEKAFGKNPGKFTRKAHRAGKSVSEYAKEEAHAPGTLGKEARLAKVGKKYGHKKHHRGARRSGRRR